MIKNSYIKLHLAVLLWGFTGILGNIIDLSSPVLVCYRMAITAITVVIYQLFTGGIIPIKGKGLGKVLLTGILFAIHWVAFYATIKLTNTSIALICLSTTGLFLSILNPIFTKSKFKIVEFLISLLAMAGIMAIYLFKGASYEKMVNFNLGIILGITAAFLAALFSISNKSIANKYDTGSIVLYEMGIGALFILVIMPLFIHFGIVKQLSPKGIDWLWLVIMAVACTVLPQYLIMQALKKLSSFTIAISVNMEPIYGIILAFIILNEQQAFGLSFYFGLGLILLSVILQIVLSMKKTA